MNGTEERFVSQWSKDAMADIRRKVNDALDAVLIDQPKAESRLRFDFERTDHIGELSRFSVKIQGRGAARKAPLR
jgi:hypothetical protein